MKLSVIKLELSLFSYKIKVLTIYGVLKRFIQRGIVENEERSGRPSLLTPRDTRKLDGVVKSDRKLPIQEITKMFNEYRARPVSDRTIQRKFYEAKYHKCVVKKSIRIRD